MLKIGAEIVCFAFFTIETMMKYFFGEHWEMSAGSCCFALGWVSCRERGADAGRLSAFMFVETRVHQSRERNRAALTIQF